MWDDVKIDYLRDHVEAIPALARFSYDEWRPVYDQAGLTYDDVVRSYEERTCVDSLPIGLVAVCAGKIVGTGSLKLHDLDVRPMYTPWLGGMYVVDGFRGKGIGTLLVKRLLVESARLSLGRLYLWTPFSESFYARHGWRTFEKLNFCGYEISIMSRTVGS